MKRAWVSLNLILAGWAITAQAQNSIYLNRTRTKLPTVQQDSSKFSAQWRLNLVGSDRNDDRSQEKTVETRLDLKSRYNLAENLYLALDPSIRFESGQTQSYDGADKSENKLLMSEASANYIPTTYLSVSAGALYQRTSHSTLLMDHLAFPAARVSVGPQNGNLKTFAFAESAIPTSTSLSTNTKELESTPGLDTVGAQVHWQNRSGFKLISSVGYFQFRNLPSAVAKDSSLLGNTVEEISAASFKFQEEFSGLESFINASFLLTPRLRLKAEAEYLVNTKAPSEMNTGYLFAGGFDYLVTGNFIVELKAATYRVAPEAAVAYFNATGFETNRIGYKTEGFLNFRKMNFRVGLRYNESEVIYTSVHQSKEKMISVLLETFYVDI